MNIQITYKTKTKDILPLLNAENIERLLEVMPEQPLETAIFSMKIKQFADILEDEEMFISQILKEKRALIAFGRLKTYKKQIEQFANFLKMYDFKKTSEETAASKGIVFPNLSQRMMSDCVRYFHLKSFTEAENCTISDWLTVFQEDAANALYQRRMHEIFEKKNKTNKKGRR